MIGDDQYIDITEKFNFKGTEVEIFRRGDEVILREKPVTAEQLQNVFEQIPFDFYEEERKDEVPQDREEF